MCAKGAAIGLLVDDPDRLVDPIRRRPGGGWQRVDWDSALAEIAGRLSSLVSENGPGSVGLYVGNPAVFSRAHAFAALAFAEGIGTPHLYSPMSQDGGSRMVASSLLYGDPLLVPVPDLARTRLILMVGANPLVSQGSMITAPRIARRLDAIVERGGRVVVADPRRSETAKRYEHVPVVPGTDAWLLAGIIRSVFEAGGQPGPGDVRGLGRLMAAVDECTPDVTAERTGVDPGVIDELAAGFVRGPAVAYGRTGACVGPFGTLVNYLLDALNCVSGNLQRRGGAVFGWEPLPLRRLAKLSGLGTVGARHSRIGGFPDVCGFFPGGILADEVTTPGPGRLRALIVTGGNPARTLPDTAAWKRAVAELDLLVSVDLYVNETGRDADFVLPATTWAERSDFPAFSLGLMLEPVLQHSPAVLEPRGAAREESRIFADLGRRMSRAGALGTHLRARLARAALRVPPGLVDRLLAGATALRAAPGGLSRLRAAVIPDGVPRRLRVSFPVPTRRLQVDLGRPEVETELRRLRSRTPDSDYGMLLVGRRERLGLNSYLHNIPTLTRSGPPRLHVHPADAATLGVSEGDDVLVESRTGELWATADLTSDVIEGVVSLPHGWSHRGGWRHATRLGGPNVNRLTPSGADTLERLAGMSHLNAVPVRISRTGIT